MNGATDELDELRNEIDQIDDRIAALISERILIAERIARVKSKGGKDLVDENREEDVKSHYEDLFQQKGLGQKNGRDLAEYVIEISLKQEKEIQRGL